MSDPATELYDIAEAAQAVADTASGLEDALLSLAGSKGLTVISRLSSGIFPGFWSLQNKIRAVFDVAEMYYKSEKKNSDALIKNMKALKSLGIMEGAMPMQLFEEGYFQDLASDLVDVSYEYGEIGKRIKDFGLYEQAIFGDKKPETDEEMTYVLKEIKILLSPQNDAIKRRKDQINKRREFQIELQKQYDKFGVKEEELFRKYLIRKKVKITKMIESIPDNLKALGKFALAGLKFFAIFTLVSWVIFWIFRNAAPALGRWAEITLEILGHLFDSIKVVASGIGMIISGLFEGDFAKIGGGLWKLLWGGLYLLGMLLITAIVPAFAFIGALIGGPLVEFLRDIRDGSKNAPKSAARLLGQVLMIVGLIGGIAAFFAGGWVAVIPYAIAAIIGGVLSMFGKRATGGVVNKPMTLVGEQGPELVSLPAGSRVYTNNQTRRMGGSTVINVNVSGRVGASDAEIKDIANKVAREINLRMNRTATTGARF